MHTLKIATSIAAVTMLSSASLATDLCHIANAGFLIKGNNASVMIDGLMIEDQYQGRFILPSSAMQQNMMDAKGLFGNLSVVVSTHKHGDHFDPKATVAHMRRNEKTNYVLPSDTQETLVANGLTADEMTRITFVPDNQHSQYNFGNIVIEAYDIDHGPNMPQNTGYRITVDGKSVFHTGDINTSRTQLSESGMNALPVDVLLIPFWFGFNDAEQRASLDASWNYNHIVPTHYQAQPAPWMDQFGGFDGLKEKVASEYENASILTNEGECMSIK